MNSSETRFSLARITSRTLLCTMRSPASFFSPSPDSAIRHLLYLGFRAPLAEPLRRFNRGRSSPAAASSIDGRETRPLPRCPPVRAPAARARALRGGGGAGQAHAAGGATPPA